MLLSEKKEGNSYPTRLVLKLQLHSVICQTGKDRPILQWFLKVGSPAVCDTSQMNFSDFHKDIGWNWR